MVEGLRRVAKRIRRRYVFGALFLIVTVGYAAVLVRAMAAAAAYKDATATFTLTSNDARSFFDTFADASSGELEFQKPARNAGIPAVEYILSLGQYAHLLRPEFQRPRQLVMRVRRSGTMPRRTKARAFIDGNLVGICSMPDGADISDCTFDLDDAQAPPADAWHIRIENPLGGMIVSRLVFVIGRR
jgi:uncharacterized membrane protein